jgi:hypothetical protein
MTWCKATDLAQDNADPDGTAASSKAGETE